MAQIPDFTDKNFDDVKLLREELTKALRALNRQVNSPDDVDLGKNTVLGWVDDGKTPLPDGYKVADGTNGTFDAKTSKIIYIQRVS